MPVIAKRRASGIAAATMSAARQFPRKDDTRDNEQRTFEQVRCHRTNRSMHQVFPVVFRANDHAQWQPLFRISSIFSTRSATA